MFLFTTIYYNYGYDSFPDSLVLFEVQIAE